MSWRRFRLAAAVDERSVCDSYELCSFATRRRCHPADRTRPVLRYAGNSGQSAVSRGGQASETAAPAKRG